MILTLARFKFSRSIESEKSTEFKGKCMYDVA